MTVGGTNGPKVELGNDAADRLTSLTRSIPVCESCLPDDRRINSSFTYDDADRLTGITHSFTDGGSPTTLADYSYVYNAASELTSESNGDGTYDYTYDATGQLTDVDASGGTCGDTGCDESFSYDVNGNRTMTGYTTDTGNRLTSDGIYDYSYDDNGNLILKSKISNGDTWEYSWDFRNRLTQVLLCTPGESGTCSDGTILQQSDYT